MASITTNMASLYAQRNLGKVQSSMPTAVERLSSGLRINRAKDDAAGLGIAEKIQSQVKATTQSVKNANDAISMVQAAEGSLGEVSSILQRMKELPFRAVTALTIPRSAKRSPTRFSPFAMRSTRLPSVQLSITCRYLRLRCVLQLRSRT